MVKLRTYGDSPFTVAVIHGGPGACGEMAPVARELASICGVLEPIQTKITLEGQIDELKETLQQNGSIPSILGEVRYVYLIRVKNRPSADFPAASCHGIA